MKLYSVISPSGRGTGHIQGKEVERLMLLEFLMKSHLTHGEDNQPSSTGVYHYLIIYNYL